MPTLPFVGRHLELASIRETCAASGTAVIVAESGLGKSRLIAELVSDPRLHCTVGVGAVELQSSPYAVFRTVALQWGRTLDPRSLGWPDHELHHLSPLFPTIDAQVATDDRNPEERRHGLWLSLVRYLDALIASQSAPVVLVVEDLQSVDDSSLALFGWLASQPLDMALIATSRPPTPALVTKLPTIGLRPLSLSAVEIIQQTIDSGSTSPATLLQLTGGIPLRLHEWVLEASLAGSAHAHGALLDRLLDGCDEIVLDTLHLAAVFPGRIDAQVIATALGVPETSALDALADAESRGVMNHHSDNTWGFHHESYRSSVVENLDRGLRRIRERQLLEALRGRLGSRRELLSHLAALATNLGEDQVEAAELHLAAGRYSLAQLASPTARDHFRAAVELTERTTNTELALQATLALALVLAALSEVEAIDALARVYPLADAAGDGDSFAQAALAEPVGMGHIGVSMMTDHRAVARLRSALAKVETPALRARVLVALAVQQHSSLTEHDYFALVNQARDIAASLGDEALDAQILAACVGARRTIDPTSTIESELQGFVDRLGPFDPNALPVVDLSVTSACRNGKLDAAEHLLRRYEDEFAPLPVVAQWSVLRAKTAIAFARGSIETARMFSLEALHTTTDTRLDETALEHFAFQIAAMLRERRKMSEARPTLETWVAEHPSYPAFRASRAWLYADLRENTAARSDLEVFFAQDLLELRGRIEGPLAISMAISAAFTIGGDDVRDWCAQGYELLRPLADEWLLVGQGSLIEGPVVRVMALASAALGETERALHENAEAFRRAQESGALLFVWHAIRDRGLILRNAGRHTEANAALADAADRYRTADLTQQADWLETLITPASPKADGTASMMGSFRRDHRVWHIALDAEVATCRHLKGMSMIAALLGSPDRPIAAGVLAAIGDDASVTPQHDAIRTASTQPIIDDQAVQAYRARLDQIVQELDRADRRGDAASSTRLTVEFDEITAELGSTHGLGTRRRTMTTEDERARVRVNKAIRSAIRRIAEQAPDLAAHLERSIDTGLFCSYRPDPLRQVDWTLH